MKRVIIGISLIALILLLWFGFSQSIDEEVVGEVIAISGEKAYTPFKQAVSGQKGNTTWDGMPLLRPNSEYLLELPSIHYEENFSFDLHGGMPIRGDYTLYDKNLEQILYWRTDSFRLPSSPGEYILCLWQTWSNGRKAIRAESASYQYYVRLIIETDDLPKKDTVEDVVGHIRIVSGTNEYQPLSFITKSLIYGVEESGEVEFQSEEVPIVFYEDNFNIVVSGGMPHEERLYYSLRGGPNYIREDGELLNFKMPIDPGEYRMEIYVTWTNGGLSWSSRDLDFERRIMVQSY
ncbi:MAG: hypothetical protein FWH49_08340, partial [Clostridiales bacterium]|nr:hypothetical protein [Clostridiales bacterium]